LPSLRVHSKTSTTGPARSVCENSDIKSVERIFSFRFFLLTELIIKRQRCVKP